MPKSQVFDHIVLQITFESFIHFESIKTIGFFFSTISCLVAVISSVTPPVTSSLFSVQLLV